MAIIKLQSEKERRLGISYQFDSADQPIGEGGMGKVYQGLCVNEQNGASRPVAIKFMFDDLPESAYERARREAEIQLRNDNLVEMLGFIETSELLSSGVVRKHYHVVSELLNGVSLADIMEGKTADRTGQDVPCAIKMMQDYKNDPEHFAQIVVINVLSGLMALHDAGYIHRDIDPSNIMLTSDGHIKLIDFGIAKQMNNLTTGDRALTVAGKFMGKPEYAAPELALGDISHQNQTTDIYAVGILLYQCIVGHTPFEGSRQDILEKQIKTKVPLNLIKNKYLREIIATACDKKQELRYQSAAQMRVALETLGSKKPISKRRVGIIVAACAVVVLVLSGVLFVVKQKQEKVKAEAAIALEEQRQQQVSNELHSMLDEAARLASVGLKREDEDTYETTLMKAYTAYVEAETFASEQGVPVDDAAALDTRKMQIVSALDSAVVEFSTQAALLQEMGEEEIATSYRNRIEAINTFRSSHR